MASNKQKQTPTAEVRFKRLEIGTKFYCSQHGLLGRWRKIGKSRVVPILANGRGDTANTSFFPSNTYCVPETK